MCLLIFWCLYFHLCSCSGTKLACLPLPFPFLSLSLAFSDVRIFCTRINVYRVNNNSFFCLVFTPVDSIFFFFEGMMKSIFHHLNKYRILHSRSLFYVPMTCEWTVEEGNILIYSLSIFNHKSIGGDTLFNVTGRGTFFPTEKRERKILYIINFWFLATWVIYINREMTVTVSCLTLSRLPLSWSFCITHVFHFT